MTKTVLLVDDEADIREVARLSLEGVAGWEVYTAANGFDALEAAQRHRLDAILLDVMMPDLDGPSVVSRLRQDASAADVPVVLLTAKTQSADRDAFAQLDIAGVLSKPFDPMRLADQVSALLGWTS